MHTLHPSASRLDPDTQVVSTRNNGARLLNTASPNAPDLSGPGLSRRLGDVDHDGLQVRSRGAPADPGGMGDRRTRARGGGVPAASSPSAAGTATAPPCSAMPAGRSTRSPRPIPDCRSWWSGTRWAAGWQCTLSGRPPAPAVRAAVPASSAPLAWRRGWIRPTRSTCCAACRWRWCRAPGTGSCREPSTRAWLARAAQAGARIDSTLIDGAGHAMLRYFRRWHRLGLRRCEHRAGSGGAARVPRLALSFGG